MLAGVAAGIAEHLEVDAAIVRLLIVVLTVITSGFGLLVYLAAIFVIPEADPNEAAPVRSPAASEQRTGGSTSAGQTADPAKRDAGFWIGVTLLVIGALWVLSALVGSIQLFPGWGSGWRVAPGIYLRELLWPLVLIGFGLALWKAGDRRETRSTSGTGVAVPDAHRTSASPTAPPPGPGSLAGAPSAPYAAGAAWTEPVQARDAATTPMARADGAAAPATGDDLVDTSTSPLPQPDSTEPPASGPSWSAAGEPPGGTAPPPGGAPADPSAGGSSGGSGPGGPAGGSPGGSSDPGSPVWSPPARPRGSLLTRITLGAALLTVGVLWILRTAGTVDLDPSRMLAAALLVVGLGLLVGTWVGRGRWLILVGWLLLPVVIVAELLRPYGVIDLPASDVRAGFGEVVVTPQTLDELEASYQLAAGSMVFDLSQLEIDEPTDLTLSVVAGEVVVTLPENVTALVTGQVAIGELYVDGRTSAGVGVPRREQAIEYGDGSELLTLQTNVGFGQVRVDGTTNTLWWDGDTSDGPPPPDALPQPDLPRPDLPQLDLPPAPEALPSLTAR